MGQATPSLEGQDLVRDALSQLDDPFLIVVVGEFNSGKSAVINALLGERVLAEGVLPTTNEISLLRWREPGSQQPEVQQVSGPAFLLERGILGLGNGDGNEGHGMGRIMLSEIRAYKACTVPLRGGVSKPGHASLEVFVLETPQ